MLKLTRKLEYALIALSHIQGQATEKIVSTKEIAETHRIPLQLLAKILQEMTKHDILEAIQGAHGGYRLKKSLDLLNVEVPQIIKSCYAVAHWQMFALKFV